MEEDFVKLTRRITRLHDTRFHDRKLQTNVSTTSFPSLPSSLYFRGIGETKVVKLYYVSFPSLPVDFVVRRLAKIHEHTLREKRERDKEREKELRSPISTFLEEAGEGRYSKKLRYSVKSTGGNSVEFASIEALTSCC